MDRNVAGAPALAGAQPLPAPVLKVVHPGWAAILGRPVVYSALRGFIRHNTEDSETLRHLFQTFGVVAPNNVQVVAASGADAVSSGVSQCVFKCRRPRSAPPQTLIDLLASSLHTPPLPVSYLTNWAAQGYLEVVRPMCGTPTLSQTAAAAWRAFLVVLFREIYRENTMAWWLAWDSVGGDLFVEAGVPPACIVWSFANIHDVQWDKTTRDAFVTQNPLGLLNRHVVDRGGRPIIWLSSGTTAACDGACANNGGADARAGYGMLFTRGCLNGLRARGHVEPYEYKWVDPGCPLAGFAPDTSKPKTPTNNRAEYLGMCVLLLAAARARLEEPVEIVVDSRLVLMTLETWLPARRAKGTEHKLTNPDLLFIAEALLDVVRRGAAAVGAPVTLVHQNSHTKNPPADAEKRLHWEANAVADRLASAGVGCEPAAEPPFWLPGHSTRPV